MPLFITYASYSQVGIKGLLSKPENRSSVVQSLIEKVGGRLVAMYNTTGTNDVVLVSEAPDGSDAVAIAMAVSASGAIARAETVRAWTSDDFEAVIKKAAGLTGAYVPPGS
ncbi:GYD domain-containing protein [Parasedimentitalea psychrophila]|uniref:GYD domain-containing protein n=1 Tax=Parasedimentitalea psychrophila TaxID=2997337 RepID=A0A9Y2KZE7_9RHOB|nr:GYD domain-containing protein [Parasedimentitalea psychrophila]WIY25498.1 GYD domain-containing protein [Parasedimentitalea psychrophila]